MRAAVMRGPGLLRTEEVFDPVCPEGGALLRVEACSVCGTDVKMLEKGHRDLTYPRVLGHEVVGTVIEADGDGLVEGDLVQVWPGIACGRCRPCLKGEDNHCGSMGILGFNRDGGFAEVMALPPESMNKGLNILDKNSDPAEMALAEPLACCLNGQRLAGVSEGDSVLIIGGGPLGCIHALLARRLGASKVLITERLKNRIELIKGERGLADRVVEEAEEDLVGAVLEECQGTGVDVTLLATPEIAVDDSLLALLAPRGRICVFSGPATKGAALDIRSIHYRELSVVGSYGCTSSQDTEAVEMIASGSVDLGWLITKMVSLDGIEEAFAYASLREGMRSAIVF